MNETILAFGYPNTLIKEYEHWVLLLRPKQVTPGSLVMASKSSKKHLGSLTPEQWSEFALVSSEAEEALVACFGAEKFNYLALMMKDPYVHFHLIPRYSFDVAIKNHTFHDSDWPLKTELETVDVPDNVLTEIQNRIKRAIKP